VNFRRRLIASCLSAAICSAESLTVLLTSDVSILEDHIARRCRAMQPKNKGIFRGAKILIATVSHRATLRDSEGAINGSYS